MNDYYTSKINRSIDYIEENLDKKITTKELAEISAFSEYHFHRIFKAVTSETVNQYIKRLKLGKSYRNMVTSQETITTIAFKYGFSSSANFSRDFRNFYNKSPRTVRNEASYPRKSKRYLKRLKLKFIGLQNLDEKDVYYIRVYTGYNTSVIQNAFSQLLDIIKANKVKFKDVRVFGIGYDDPDYTEPEKCRYDACISLKKSCSINWNNLNGKKLQSGLYAAYLFEGKAEDFANAWDFILRTWMSDDSFRPDNKPHFEEYLPSLGFINGTYKAKLYLPITPF